MELDNPSTQPASQHSEPEKTMSRKDRIRIKAQIRKTKVQPEISNENEKLQTKLSKEERALIQKLKNRQSAQRSRDQRKQYIMTLEQQNSTLRADRDRLLVENDRLNRMKTCAKCKGSLESTTCDINTSSPDEFQSQVFLEGNRPTEDMSFERMIEEPVSRMPMFLFVCFTIIGAMMVGTDTSAGPATMPIQQPSILVNMDSVSKALVPTYRKHENSCLAQYLVNQEVEKPIEPPRNLRSREVVKVQNDVLLCRRPHLVRRNESSKLFSKNLQILMEGNQLDVTGIHSNQQISPNDLYMLLVQVKGVQKYTGYKCLSGPEPQIPLVAHVAKSS